MPSLTHRALGGLSRALGALSDAVDPLGKASSARGGAPDEVNQAPVIKATEDAKSLMWDPFTVLEQLGYKDRPSSVSFETLRQIYFRLPVVSDIIKLRVNQVASFCSPQRSRYDIGFRIKPRDTTAQPSTQDKKFIEQMQAMILHTGASDNTRGRPTFETYMRKVAFDSLLYDQNCTEIVHNRKGQPAEFYAVDATSIRLADSAKLHLDEDLSEEVRYVQIYDNAVVCEYSASEMIFGVRNPTTNMRTFGYGESELEVLTTAITSLLYGIEYNAKYFQQGSVAKGILNFKGAMPERQLSNFKRQWYAMASGVENAWRTPVINTPEGTDMAWVPLSQSNKDMEFSAWMDFLIKLICGAFQMDPAEINFKYGTSDGRSSMNEESNRDKVVESRERGLRPLLRHFASNLNQHIIWPINPAFELEFVGLDSMTREEVAELNLKRGKSYLTIDELRAEDNLEPLPDGAGKIILDPTYTQYMAQKSFAAQGGGAPSAGASKPEGGQGAANDDGADDEAEQDDPDDGGQSVSKSWDDGGVHLDIRI